MSSDYDCNENGNCFCDSFSNGLHDIVRYAHSNSYGLAIDNVFRNGYGNAIGYSFGDGLSDRHFNIYEHFFRNIDGYCD